MGILIKLPLAIPPSRQPSTITSRGGEAFVTLNHILRLGRGTYSPDGLRTGRAGCRCNALFDVGGIALVGWKPKSFGKSVCRAATTATGQHDAECFIALTTIDDKPDGPAATNVIDPPIP
jgi:hypothetical protein